jgi:hypothetical protein
MYGRENKKLEKELREEWNKWNNRVHLEDQMSFIDYVDEINEYKGSKVSLDRDQWGDMKILFS